ncbi:MAG: N-acetylglucosamine-6-phosphate deacetylase [Candidatus Dormibacteraeota bacterium]|nr:N-acetylglucosamine-6-phosphate deacetylase [Candidatus Dormibacteraeota bacterium]
MTVLAGLRVVTPGEVLEPGWVHVDGARIIAVGTGLPPRWQTPVEDFESLGHWLVPGFIDLHVHGGGGASFTSGNADEVRRAVAFHLAHGSTRTLASLITAPLGEMAAAAKAVAAVVRGGPSLRGHLVGCHLEGPFLSAQRCGAHEPRHLLEPEEGSFLELLRAGEGTVRMITLAPELPRAGQLMRVALEAGLVVAVGHTDATYEQAATAFADGAAVATHLFNGMRPVHHRDPGPAVAALNSRHVVCELINDGVHLDDAMVRLAFNTVGAGRVALITDAIAAAGMGDGDYRLGSQDVRVEGDRVQLKDGHSLAGSTLTMDRALGHAVFEVGLDIKEAVTAASTTPARVLGVEDRAGSIEPGKDADLVVLDEGLEVVEVMAAGRWVRCER